MKAQRVASVKVGALGGRQNVHAVARLLSKYPRVPVVIDTPMTPTLGTGRLLAAGALAAMREELAPRATLLTANIDEVFALLGGRARTPSETSPIRLNADHYVRAAIEGECAAVAATPEGSRNHRLNRAAFSLGTLVGARLLDAEEARADLFAAAVRAGLTAAEARRTVASGLDAGQRRPRRTASSLVRGDRARSGDRSRPADPWTRPVEPATAAVLARARGTGTSPRVRPVALPPH